MHRYQQQCSTQTLIKGLEEYHSCNSGLVERRNVSTAEKEFFRCHDVVHVVFGCDTTLSDEAVVKISTIFGTSIGLQVLRGYGSKESKEIYRKLSLFDIILTTIQSIILVPMTIWHCIQMRKRWPWSNYDRYLEMPLNEIRRKFGIRVAHSR